MATPSVPDPAEASLAPDVEGGGRARSAAPILVRVSGPDRPGITAGLLATLAEAGADVLDMEQVTVRGRLTLDLLVDLENADRALRDLLFFGWEQGLDVDFEIVDEPEPPARKDRWVVTLLGATLPAAALADAARSVADAGANIDRILRLSDYPVRSFAWEISGGDVDAMRAGLLEVSRRHGIDVALQREGLARRAKRLVVLDVDSTLIQDEVIDLLAAQAGVGDEVAAITEAAMAGDIDFEEALRRRVAALAGLTVEDLERVAERIRLTPGARTFVRTLQRLGYELAIVSGGFTWFTDRIATDLGIRHAFANQLEIVDGRLTGRLIGPVVDRKAKAMLLERVAAEVGVPPEQVVAIGDGANDLDMLAAAGLGVAFNAKPVVRAQADTAVSVPFLDAILFVLGIRREDVEAADEADGLAVRRPPVEPA